MSEEPARLAVALGPRSYEIIVERDLLGRAADFIAPLLRQRRTITVTDRSVAALHLPALEHSLRAAGIECERVIVEAGEGAKDFRHLEALIERLIEMGVERGTTLIALGGGVIGDLAGFAASILLRGIDFIQIPTTLLAQVDSSVGGKTGINTSAGKNLVGSFHQPRLVLADIDTLATLPPRELRAGYAEIVKYGLIGDAGFFAWLERNGGALLAGDAAARRHAVLTSCAAKAAIVAEDERESGSRALLNLGHTFGHALEAECGYSGRLLHGEAVAIGMALAFDLSARLGLCPAADAARLRRHLTDVGLPVVYPGLGESGMPERLLNHMGRDKKVRGGRLTFVLAEGIGRARIVHDVDPAEVRGLLARATAA